MKPRTPAQQRIKLTVAGVAHKGVVVVFVNYVSNMKLIHKIYSELLMFSHQKKREKKRNKSSLIPNVKNQLNISKDIHPQKTSKQPQVHGKMYISDGQGSENQSHSENLPSSCC